MAVSIRDRLAVSRPCVFLHKRNYFFLLVFLFGPVFCAQAQSPSGLSLAVQHWNPNLPSNFVSPNGYYTLNPAGGACTTTDINGDGAIDIYRLSVHGKRIGRF